MISYFNGYVRGIFNMASSSSKLISMSYIEAYCYDKKNFNDEFSKDFKIKKFNINLTNKEYLNNYLEKEIIDNALYWIKFQLGDVLKYYVMDNLNVRNTTFYTVDDIIVLEYNKYIVCLIIGNNE